MSQNNAVFQFLRRVFCPEWESIIAAIGRICSRGIPHAECYGVRLPNDYDGEVPPQMLMMDVSEAEYVVFERVMYLFHAPTLLEVYKAGEEIRESKFISRSEEL